MNIYIGIDVGTTNLKVLAFDEGGELITSHSEPTPCVQLGSRSAEMDPVQIWETVKKGLKTVCSSVNGTIRSIGISSMGESGILCDQNGKPLYPFIIWYDVRPEKMVEKLLGNISSREIFEETGQIPAVKYGIFKLMWLKETYPDLYQQAAHWLSVEDWILFCLSGEFATDYSIAARTMVFNAVTCSWSEKVLNAAGIDKNLFSKPYPGGTKIGTIRKELAEELGISEQVGISTGGHDHACAAISINILEDNCVLDSMGTAEVLMMATDQPLICQEAFDLQYCIYPHCGDRKYRIVTSNQSCGACVEWYLNTYGQYIRDVSKQKGISAYDYLTQLAESQGREESDVLFLPFIRGAVENKYLKGTFIGLHDRNTEGDYIQAMIDGLGYEIRMQVEGYAKLIGKEIKKVKVVGGPSKSSYIMKRKSLTQNCVIETAECPEAAGKGAALLGAIAVGDTDFSSLDQFYEAKQNYVPSAQDEKLKMFERYQYFRNGISELYLADGTKMQND